METGNVTKRKADQPPSVLTEDRVDDIRQRMDVILPLKILGIGMEISNFKIIRIWMRKSSILLNTLRNRRSTEVLHRYCLQVVHGIEVIQRRNGGSESLLLFREDMALDHNLVCMHVNWSIYKWREALVTDEWHFRLQSLDAWEGLSPKNSKKSKHIEYDAGADLQRDVWASTL
ncbi:hypothetical protein Trydic_g6292 [Trypoxylus dichotomus]